MRSPDELRAILDALPRPLRITGYVQIIGAPDPVTHQQAYHTASFWQNPGDAQFMVEYMQQEPTE
jgi:hypothetical protein